MGINRSDGLCSLYPDVLLRQLDAWQCLRTMGGDSSTLVPMLMTVGYSPEVIQAAYRIGDSTTNIITPMMSYFGLILAFAMRYDKNLGIGTLISMMTLLDGLSHRLDDTLLHLVFAFGLPCWPGTPTFYP